MKYRSTCLLDMSGNAASYCCLIAVASLRDVSRACAQGVAYFPDVQRCRRCVSTYTHTFGRATYAAAHISRRCQPLERTGGSPNPRNYEGLSIYYFSSLLSFWSLSKHTRHHANDSINSRLIVFSRDARCVFQRQIK